MKKKSLLGLTSFLFLFFLTGCEMVVFQPQGPVASTILELINFSMILMLFVVLVVFALFTWIIIKYREKADDDGTDPEDEEGSIKLEITWTVIPIIIIIALTIPTVITTYNLEKIPADYEEIEPITINVTSADWKWIFSYPEYDIETVNYVNIPEDTPIEFRLTSAGTMQSFWVPALAGQKYTMANHETQLFLVADKPGSYIGRNTSFNGRGFAHMDFEVLSQTHDEFKQWVEDVRYTAPALTESEYEELLKPGIVGRMTFNNTHLDWVNHGEHDSTKYLYPELYRYHGYQGKIFTNENEDTMTHDEHSKSESHNSHENGGDHNGH